MKLPSLTVALIVLAASPNDAFVPRQSAFRRLSTLNGQRNLHEFDFLLKESANSPIKDVGQSRRRIMLNDERATVLASTTYAQPTEQEEFVNEEADPYADIGLEQVNPKVMQLQESKPSLSQRFEDKLKTMDFQDIVSTLVIPSIVAFAGIRWGFNRVSARVSGKADDLLDAFASEMIYHDGDFEEMKMCYSDYTTKLAWLGPTKTQSMLKRYLELYSKKRTVSPQAISSLSYVFSLFKLSEQKAAEILVLTCRAMGDEKISSAGKLLFFGSRILKSPEGKAALAPIKQMIMATYREATVAETMVDTSQQAMAEAAYRTAVIAAGKDQKSLTVGWEVLGLSKETATRIFEAEAEEGFMTDRERMYGGQTTKYDAKGRIIDKEGKLVDEKDKKAAEEEKEVESSSNVYECSECGYTLFIAKGREFKFYGDDFTCPECGAGKDKFNPRDIEED